MSKKPDNGTHVRIPQEMSDDIDVLRDQHKLKSSRNAFVTMLLSMGIGTYRRSNLSSDTQPDSTFKK